MLIRPKNWREFQHYKDRNPPWIRLHKHLLDNFEFQRLPVASRALAPMLWLLASDSLDGSIDASPAKLAFRLRMSEKDVIDALKPLIDNGFFAADDVCSEVLATCLHGAVPETETETETEIRAKRVKADASVSVQDLVSEGVDPAHARDWFMIRKDKGAKKLTVTAWKAVKTEAEKARMTPAQAVKIAAENTWQGFKAAWLQNHTQGRPTVQTQQQNPFAGAI